MHVGIWHVPSLMIQTYSLILRPWNEAGVVLRPWNEAGVVLRPWNEASVVLRSWNKASVVLRPWNEASIVLRPWNEASVVLRPWNEATSNPELLSRQLLYPRLWEISETKILDWKLLAPIHKAVYVMGAWWLHGSLYYTYVGCSGPWNSNHEWSMDPQLLGTQRLTVRL